MPGAWPVAGPRGRLPTEPRHRARGRYRHGFFVVISGLVRVVRDGAVVARLGPGEFFGELSVLDRLPRNATVARRGADELPRPRVVGLREGPPGAAGPDPRDPARRSRRGSARSASRRATEPSGGRRHADLPLHRHRGLDAAARRARRGRVHARSSSARPRSCARPIAAPRRPRAGHGGRLVLRRLRQRRRRGRAAAVDAQRALAAEPWPRGARGQRPDGPPRRRGVATAPRRLVGIDVNRAARIAAAAHGGQVARLRRGPRARRRGPRRPASRSAASASTASRTCASRSR